MDINTFLNHLEKVKQTGNDKWMACCPAHDDRSPSMAIKAGDDGKIILHCFAGCPAEEIVSSIGLKLTDLFPDNGIQQQHPDRPSNREITGQLEHELFVMLSAIGHYKKRIPLHEQDQDRPKQAAKRIIKALGVLYGV